MTRSLFIFGAAVLLTLPQLSSANDLEELEKELANFQQQVDESDQPLPLAEQKSLLEALAGLKERGCKESYTVANSQRFITSFNAQGEPCKIYDLGAHGETLEATPQMPVKRLGARAYLDLLRGNDNRTMNLASRYARSVRPRDRDNFWKPVRSKLGPNFQQVNWDDFKLDEILPEDVSLPHSIVQNFSILEAIKPPEVEFSVAHLKDLKQLLSMVRMQWDDDSKTYQMNLNEVALGLSRQAVILNYNNPLIPMWNQVYRSVLSNALQVATFFIPDMIIGNIARIAIVDTFTMLNVFSKQRMLRLETVLRLNLEGHVATQIDEETLTRGLNLTYANREGAMMRWVWDSIKRFSFTWAGYERIAEFRRGVAENRKDDFIQRNQRSLQNKRCEVTPVFDDFAVCYKKGQPAGVFNLSVFRSLMFFRFGPILVYSHARPWEVWTKRVAAWTLSVASRLFSPFIYDPQKMTLNGALSDTLRSYALQGWAEEAVFYENLEHSPLDPRRTEDANLLKDL